MGRGVRIWLCALLLVCVQATTTEAASDLQLSHAPDGTLVVAGSGWRPGDRLVLSVGQSQFATFVDGTGDFEVATGLASYQGPLAVHRSATATDARIDTEAPGVVFAQAIAEGLTLLAALSGLCMLTLGIRRYMTRAHYPRQ